MNENTQTVQISGMHCASCASIIERTLKKETGMKGIRVNVATETASVRFDPEKTSIAALNVPLKPLGYSLSPMDAVIPRHSARYDHPKEAIDSSKAHTGLALAFISAGIMAIEVGSTTLGVLPPLHEVVEEFFHHLMPIIATYTLFGIGTPYLRGLWVFIRHGVANMDSLIGLGTVTAYVYSFIVSAFETVLPAALAGSATFYDVTVVVIGLVTFGKFMETRAKERTGEAIHTLLELQAKTALVIREGIEQEILLEDVVVGDIVRMKPGMTVPVDGTILEGTASLDESLMTGEPLPVDKEVGGIVHAGTRNTTTAFTMRAAGVGGDTMLSRIIRLVEEAQQSHAPIEKLADRISAIFVPAVLVIALISLFFWILVGSQYLPLTTAISYAISCFVGVLVIACPCALGLATPTAIVVGVGKGAQSGILIKNAEILQKLHDVKTVLFDKTGTITEGKPTVLSFKPLGERPKRELLEIFASLENPSEHPLGESIVTYAKNQNVEPLSVTDFRSVPGKGVRGTLNGIEYVAGKLSFLSDEGYVIPQEVSALVESSVDTPVLLGSDTQLLAVVFIGDALKTNAMHSISALHAQGIKTVMLTGDSERTAQAVATQVGIDEVRAGVLPQEKEAIVLEYQANGNHVAMAGDGVNDAPALARADVGIAMSTGSDVAIETSDVTILHGDIGKVGEAITLSRKTMRTIKQNLFWAFAYNVIGIPLAAGLLYPFTGWLLSPAFAGLAMSLSSISVVMNSLRLKRAQL